MPTLQRRVEDGEYYVRHFFKQHSTWQILGEGVRILRHRRVDVGGYFSTDLFMELLTQGLVYHGSTFPLGQLRVPPDPEEAPFHERVANFHDFLHDKNLDSAKSLLAPSVLEDEQVASFLEDVGRWGLEQWKRTDTLPLSDIDFEVVEQDRVIFKASKLGTVYINVSLQSEERELRQYWVYGERNWWLVAIGVQIRA